MASSSTCWTWGKRRRRRMEIEEIDKGSPPSFLVNLLHFFFGLLHYVLIHNRVQVGSRGVCALSKRKRERERERERVRERESRRKASYA